MVYYKDGNLLEAEVDYICYQVNCQGRMGSGIAKQIREKWPTVYNFYVTGYMNYNLGSVQIVKVDNNKSVVNMFGQEFYGYDGKRYTSYDAFWSCLGKIRNLIPKGSRVGLPDHIGCGLGGANWEVIRIMIEQALGEDYEVYIYKFGGEG